MPVRENSMPYIRLDDGTEFNLTIPVTHLSQPERFKKALKKFGLFFAMAVASILVPVFHFVLVPALLIAAVTMAVQQYKRVYSLDLSGVKCPRCQEDLKEGRLTTKENKFSVYCFQCRRNLFIGV